MSQETIYLDHSATTPVDEAVIQAMLPYWTQAYGNPSSSHVFGRDARQGLESGRRKIASILSAKPAEIIFTGCGSESDNLAVRGVMLAARQANPNGPAPHIITSVIEHEAIINTAEQLRDLHGFGLTIVGVDQYGRVNPAEVEAAIRPETALISIMAANNEVGTMQPFEKIGQIAQTHDILFHTDGVQAANAVDWDLSEMPIDLLSLAPHKFYGPKGVGILYIRDGVNLVSALTGGGQENGIRAGTVNVPFAVGAAEALELAMNGRDAYITHCQKLRDRLIEGMQAAFTADEMQLTGHPTERLPHHASFAFNGLSGNDLLVNLDLLGIAGSSGSACSTGNPKPSTILEAVGLEPEWTRGGLRLTVGKHNTAADIDYVLENLPQAIHKLRQFSAAFS